MISKKTEKCYFFNNKVKHIMPYRRRSKPKYQYRFGRPGSSVSLECNQNKFIRIIMVIICVFLVLLSLSTYGFIYLSVSKTTGYVTNIAVDNIYEPSDDQSYDTHILPTYQGRIDFDYCTDGEELIENCNIDKVYNGYMESDINTYYATIAWVYDRISTDNTTTNTIYYKTYYPDIYMDENSKLEGKSIYNSAFVFILLMPTFAFLGVFIITFVAMFIMGNRLKKRY